MNFKVSINFVAALFLVFASGSASAQTTQIEGCTLQIFFPNNVSLLNATQISEIREFIQGATSDSFAVRGYSSNVGETEYNLQISNDRAINVGAVILQQGFEFQPVPLGEAGQSNFARRAEIYRDNCASEVEPVGQPETLLPPRTFIYALGAVVLGALATGGSSSTSDTQ